MKRFIALVVTTFLATILTVTVALAEESQATTVILEQDENGVLMDSFQFYTDGPEILEDIMENHSLVVDNNVYSIKLDLYKKLQNYAEKNMPTWHSELWDWGVNSVAWPLDAEYAFRVTDSRQFELTSRSNPDYVIRLQCEEAENVNADFPGGKYKLWTFKNFTIVPNVDGFSIWHLGTERKVTDKNLFNPQLEDWHVGAGRYVFSCGKKLYLYMEPEEKLVQIGDDYAGKAIMFCNSLFYINDAAQVVSVNLVTNESELVYVNDVFVALEGSDSIYAVTIDGNRQWLPGFVDWDGQINLWNER